MSKQVELGLVEVFSDNSSSNVPSYDVKIWTVMYFIPTRGRTTITMDENNISLELVNHVITAFQDPCVYNPMFLDQEGDFRAFTPLYYQSFVVR